MNKELKAFLRLIKEIGLYTQWSKNRKKYTSSFCISKHDFGELKTFFNFLSSSFIWSVTDNMNLWAGLCDNINEPLSSKILENEKLINILKKNVENRT